MTKPTLIAFADVADRDLPKVYLRGMLYSTARTGKVVENMLVRLWRSDRQDFSVWIHSAGGKYSRGSGLYVGHEGVSLDHHFTLPRDGTAYRFLPGDYTLEVFAVLVGKKRQLLLNTVKLHLTEQEANALSSRNGTVFFDWGAESQAYRSHFEPFPEDRALPEKQEPALQPKEQSHPSDHANWTIDAALKIELMPRDEFSAVLRNRHTEIYLYVRVLNCAPFPVRVHGMNLKWELSGEAGLHQSASQTVVDEFRLLQPGAYQIHEVRVQHDGVEVPGSPVSFVRLAVVGEVVAASEQWDGPKKLQIATSNWGLAHDERRWPTNTRVAH